MYGDELKGLSPEMIFDKKDSEKALEDAEFVFKKCEKLIKEWMPFINNEIYIRFNNYFKLFIVHIFPFIGNNYL